MWWEPLPESNIGLGGMYKLDFPHANPLMQRKGGGSGVPMLSLYFDLKHSWI